MNEKASTASVRAAAANRPPASPLSRTVTLLLADDHASWRGGVRSMLEDTEFEIAAETASCHETLKAARRIRPEITLLDIRMGDGNGLDVLRALKAEQADMAVVMLTTYVNPAVVTKAVAWGASGYLCKGIEFDALIYALRRVVAGANIILLE
jgi:DNA-binding NarL/FixJ family response regulator